jgi:hypothetical protein
MSAPGGREVAISDKFAVSNPLAAQGLTIALKGD